VGAPGCRSRRLAVLPRRSLTGLASGSSPGFGVTPPPRRTGDYRAGSADPGSPPQLFPVRVQAWGRARPVVPRARHLVSAPSSSVERPFHSGRRMSSTFATRRPPLPKPATHRQRSERDNLRHVSVSIKLPSLSGVGARFGRFFLRPLPPRRRGLLSLRPQALLMASAGASLAAHRLPTCGAASGLAPTRRLAGWFPGGTS